MVKMRAFFCLLGILAIANAKSIDIFVPDSNFGYISKFGTPLAEKIQKYEQMNYGKPTGSRVLNGQPAALGQFPWQALLYMEYAIGTAFAGGSLISPNRVLTAAHNWNDGEVTALSLRVNFGTIRLNEGLVVAATDVVMHEDYFYPTLRNDIAIAYLSQAVQYTNLIQPIPLPFGDNEVSNDFNGAIAIASGFGHTQIGVTGNLNYVELKVLSNEQCIQEFGNLGEFVQPENICTSGTGEIGICSGDSGGPLITHVNNKPVIIGISSFGTAVCAGNTSPSAYIRVTSYKDWIEKHL